jgi:ABC-2 type transport system permease protein
MTAGITPVPSGIRTGASRLSRVYGLGSVYAKTLRDSRLSLIMIGGLVAVMLISGAAAFGQAYNTAQSRIELEFLVNSLPPAMAGVYGNPFPAAITTMGGSIGWKTAASLGLLVCLWSILAMSGTLAGEIRRGSLEFVATAPLGMRRIALEKLGAHLTGMAIVVLVTFLSALAGNPFASLPGDEITVEMAAGYALWIGAVGLASGSVAFALAPVVGRGASAAIAGAILLIGYFANGYQLAVPAVAPVANLTWFGWTAHHQPLGGSPDWLTLLPVYLVALVLFAAGVELFARRDLGVTVRIPWPSLPGAILGLGGPFGRSFGERFPAATWWGIGVGLMGFVFGAAALSFTETLAQMTPDVLAIFQQLFPSVDLLSGAGAFLQLAFITFGFILGGFAAATLVNGWSADETEGRLELLLATPMSRARWALRGGLGVYAAVAWFTLLVMVGIGVGSVLAGGDVATPIVGTLVIGLYALAMAGIGLAFGGLVTTTVAAEVVALLVILMFLVDLLVPALDLPDALHQLSLTAHLGQPMLGIWDWPGMIACVAIAVVGLLLSAWGISRRDVAR